MKKKLLILLLCLLVVSQLAFAREKNIGKFNVSIGATLGEIDENIRLIGFNTRGNVVLDLSKKVQVGTSLSYSHLIDSKSYVEGKANIFRSILNACFNPTINSFKPTINTQFEYEYIDASTIDSNTGKITAPCWRIDSNIKTAFSSNNALHNMMFGVLQELTKKDGLNAISHYGQYAFSDKSDKYTGTTAFRYNSAFIDNQKYSCFLPSVAFGWTPILPKASGDISYLKLRLGWEKTGDSDVILDGTSSDWEVTTQHVIGVDARFMDNIINVSEDIFVKKTVNDVESILLYGNELVASASKTVNTLNYKSNFSSVVTLEKTEDGSELYASGFGANFNFTEKEFYGTANFSYNYLRDFDIEDNEYEKQATAEITTGYYVNKKFSFADTIRVDMVLVDGAYATDLSFSTLLNSTPVVTKALQANTSLNCNFLLINNSERSESPVSINLINNVSGQIGAKINP